MSSCQAFHVGPRSQDIAACTIAASLPLGGRRPPLTVGRYPKATTCSSRRRARERDALEAWLDRRCSDGEKVGVFAPFLCASAATAISSGVAAEAGSIAEGADGDTMSKARHVRERWGFALGLALVQAPACKGEPGDSASSSATSSAGMTSSSTSSGGSSSTTSSAGATSTSSSSGGSSSSTTAAGTGSSSGNTASSAGSGSTGSGVCAGPEHEEFRKALCPDRYPNCVPYPPDMAYEKFCKDHGFGPVGSGECACTPRYTQCGVEGSDEIIVLCCCPLEDLEVDP